MTGLEPNLALRFRPKQSHARAWRFTAAGSLGAVLLFELVLRFFVASWHYPKTPVREIRQYMEGTVTSHFVADGFGTYGNRLTGNSPVANAPTVLLIGDSHLIQEGVADEDTAGAEIERLSRGAGTPVNVRQYGWYSTAAPTYIAAAPDLLKSINPKQVVVVLNYTDFGWEALSEGWYWVMKIHPDLSVDLIDVRVPEPKGKLAEIREFMGRSSLMVSLRRRGNLLFPAGGGGAPGAAAHSSSRASELPLIARASVRALKRAYGSRLIIAYTPVCGVTCPSTPEPSEADLLEACRSEDVRCFSARPGMRADMDKYHHLLRGFHNTAPGFGHLNKFGLHVVGAAIWREISPVSR